MTVAAFDPRHSAGGGFGIDAPITLADLLDGRARKVLQQATHDLGVGVHVSSEHGQVLAGSELPAWLTERVGTELELLPVDERLDDSDEITTGRRYLAQALLHEGDVIGWLAVGPYPVDRENGVKRVAGYLGHLVDHLLVAGLEKVYASRMHSASMEDAHAELQQKNERLRLAVERLTELDRIKSNFLATVSHELRTPLTSVIGYSEMLLEGIAGDLTDEQRDYMTTVMEKGEQLLGIITSILDISKIEAGQVTLDRTLFPINEVVQAAISTVAPSARKKSIAMRAELSVSLPQVRADRDKIRQVLVNLLGNAVKFTPDGGEVVVRAEEATLSRSAARSLRSDGIGDGGPEGSAGADELVDEDDAELSLSSSLPSPGAGGIRALRVMVSDNGIGIPVEAQGKVFDPFFQVDNTSTRAFGGTGLGLSIVRSLVEAHGGAVWVESTPGAGSTFSITLPVGG